MPRKWLSATERLQRIHQELTFAAAGIGDLVNVDDPDADPDATWCPECGEADCREPNP